MSKKNTTRVTRAAFNPLDPDSTNDPLLKKAMKEPVAFFGGMFAGMLGLSVNDEPLREWVDKTSEAAGMTREEAIAAQRGSLVELDAGLACGNSEMMSGNVPSSASVPSTQEITNNTITSFMISINVNY